MIVTIGKCGNRKVRILKMFKITLERIFLVSMVSIVAFAFLFGLHYSVSISAICAIIYSIILNIGAHLMYGDDNEVR